MIACALIVNELSHNRVEYSIPAKPLKIEKLKFLCIIHLMIPLLKILIFTCVENFGQSFLTIQVNQSRVKSATQSQRKHDDVPYLDLKLSQSNEALGKLRQVGIFYFLYLFSLFQNPNPNQKKSGENQSRLSSMFLYTVYLSSHTFSQYI
jgi:hypothetical protein